MDTFLFSFLLSGKQDKVSNLGFDVIACCFPVKTDKVRINLLGVKKIYIRLIMVKTNVSSNPVQARCTRYKI